VIIKWAEQFADLADRKTRFQSLSCGFHGTS